MRITQRALTANALTGINNNLAALNKYQDQMSTGKVLTKPSDSPTDTNKAMQTRSGLASLAQQARNITDATARLDQTDTALSTMQDLLQRVQVLTTKGLNTGSNDATANAAIATEVAALRQSMLGTANSTVASTGQSLFGGVSAGPLAYEADGTYAGTDGFPVTRRIGDLEQIRVDVTGTEAFGEQPDDLFALVQGIVDKLSDPAGVDTAGLSADLAALGDAQDRLSTVQSAVGARAARVDDAAAVNSDRKLTLTAQLAAIENVDIAKATLELSAQQVGYQAALSVASKVLQPSLMDFLN
jgi:flagellar hook-associated protein 3 FlgL